MIFEIPLAITPEWLEGVDSSNIERISFPVRDILVDSFYYPCSGFDGNPVRFFAGNFYSFIYVDYGRTEEQFITEIQIRGFNGYEVVAQRKLSEKDLAPNGWQPPPLLRGDGKPQSRAGFMQKPFAYWLIFERKPEMPESHGPRRFSLVYLCADGSASFHALYVTQAIKPRAVAIVQPGHSFGGNYTNYHDTELIFGRTVLNNPAGTPEFILNGSWDCSPDCSCWPEYDMPIWQHKTAHRGIFLFKKGGNPVEV